MGQSEPLGLVGGCLLLGQESNSAGCHWWRGTAEEGSSGAEGEVVVEEEVEEQV